MQAKVWFITGASRGFGKIWAEAALRRGDKVVATARHPQALADLVDTYGDAILPLPLDVTDRAATFAAVQHAHATFGRLDVVLNNAGYGQSGFVEELTEEAARAQLDTNLFGSLWVIQAALPLLRAQGSGHFVQVSSIGGVVAFPTFGIYNASKWGIEGLCDALAQEVAGFGLHVTLIEPGNYATDFGSSVQPSPPLAAYQGLRDAIAQGSAGMPAADPAATAAALLQIVDSPTPPLRLFLGTMPQYVVEPAYQVRLATWHEWAGVAAQAQG